MKDWFVEDCPSVDEDTKKLAEQRQSQLTKPPGSLGRLEQVAIDLSAMQSQLAPSLERVEIAIFAGDHGVMDEGVSAFPQIVTTEMVKNFVRGGAAISVMARQIGAGLSVINAGTIDTGAFDSPVVDRPVAHGTANFAREAAMSKEQCLQALALGRDIIDGFNAGTQLVIGGEMGIGNTSSATALAAAFGVSSAASLVGPGTGLDADGVSRKLQVIETALARVGQDLSAIDIITEFGGFEIVALAGYYIRSAQKGMTILVDGFISSVAALAACRINPQVRQWMLFSHGSAEPGHRLVLQAMSAEPLLALEMRLGEGSGAAVVVSLLRSACALQNEMATFAEAGVSDA